MNSVLENIYTEIIKMCMKILIIRVLQWDKCYSNGNLWKFIETCQNRNCATICCINFARHKLIRLWCEWIWNNQQFIGESEKAAAPNAGTSGVECFIGEYGYAYREHLIFEKTFLFLSIEFKYNNFTHKIYSNVRKNIDYQNLTVIINTYTERK